MQLPDLIEVKIKSYQKGVIIGLAALFSFLKPTYSLAEECLVSTSANMLMTGYPALVQEKLNEQTGRYSALLGNGDSVLASFDTCGLGLKAHYLSVGILEGNELSQVIREFLSRLLVSEVIRQKVLSQLEALSTEEFVKGVTLSGMGDQHVLSLRGYPYQGVGTIIHYRWIPPEH